MRDSQMSNLPCQIPQKGMPTTLEVTYPGGNSTFGEHRELVQPRGLMELQSLIHESQSLNP
jgi:hypothetical protein